MDTIWSPYAGELSWVLAPFIPSFQAMTKAFRKRFFEDHDGGEDQHWCYSQPLGRACGKCEPPTGFRHL